MTNIHPTKLAIMQAAIEIFIKKGFNGTTTKEIAQAAGIAEGTVFRHFANKAEILYGIVEGFIALMDVDTLKQTITEREYDIRDAMEYIIENRFQLIQESIKLAKIIVNESNYDSKLRKIYREQVYNPLQRMVRDFITDGIQNGHFREVDPNLTASIILSFLFFEIAQECASCESADHSFTARRFTDILLNGITKRG